MLVEAKFEHSVEIYDPSRTTVKSAEMSGIEIEIDMHQIIVAMRPVA